MVGTLFEIPDPEVFILIFEDYDRKPASTEVTKYWYEPYEDWSQV
jgi:hypothetical protein